MKNIDREVVRKQFETVKVSNGVVITSEALVEAMHSSADEYNMAHGSHKQHSSSSEYDD